MERQVTFKSGNLTLAGTLSFPQAGGKYPAVLLIPGSGPIDRNENHRKMKLNLFFELSAFLTWNGFTVLRYDKPGIGKSQGNYWSSGFFDNVSAATAATEFLKSREETDPGQVYLLGHSEGAFISTRIAATTDIVNGIILLAGAANSGEEVLKWQALRIVEGMKGFNKWILNTFRIDVAESQQKKIDKIKKTTQDVLRVQLIAKINAKWMREFLAYNPADDMPDIKVPVLAITGSKDIQVNPEDLHRMNDLIKSPFEYHIVPNVTHILRNEPGQASISAYKNQTKQPMDRKVQELVMEWLKRQTGENDHTTAGDTINRDIIH